MAHQKWCDGDIEVLGDTRKKSECSKLSVQPTNFLLPVRIVKLSASRWFPNKPLADTLVTLIFQNILSDDRSRQTANASSKLLSFSCRFQERPQLKKKKNNKEEQKKKGTATMKL